MGSDEAFAGLTTSFRGERVWVWTAEHKKLLAGVERLREALPLPATEPLTVDQVFGEAVAWIARGRNRDLLVAERDALAADNARLVADSKALAAVDRHLVDAGLAGADIVQAVADVLAEREDFWLDLKLCQEALSRISAALTATGRDADSCGHGGPTDVADAVEEALLDLSARWRGRDEALERIREALGAGPSWPVDIADAAIRALATLRATHHDRVTATMLGAPAWLDVRDDVLRPAPATGGDCGGEA